MSLIFLLLLSSTLFAADFRVVGQPTSTTAVLAYRTSYTGNCTLEVSEESDYSPVVHDVNGTYFSGANSDARYAGMRDGQERYFPVGLRAVHEDADGVRRSRALQTATKHYARLDCNGTQETLTFRTATIPFGMTVGDLPPGDPDKPGHKAYFWPTLNPMHHGGVIIDPWTGARLQYVNTAAWAQGRTTASGGQAFSSASGTGWTPTSSTLTAALASVDSNFATSSTADKLLLQVSTANTLVAGTFPSASLSYQNLELSGYRCVGAGCGSAVVHVCVTLNLLDDTPVCEPPEKTLTGPSTSSGSLTICYDIPCTTAKNPGDWFTFERPFLNGQYTATEMSDYTVYTTTGDNATLKFNNAQDCTRLVVGDVLGVYKSTTNTEHSLTVSAMSCGSSPPQVTVSGGVALDHNGTAGLPFLYKVGIGSPRYGFMLWITGADAALEIDSIKWVAAKDTGISLSPGSGGFGQRSSSLPSANGFYHASCQSECTFAYKAESDGSTTLRYLGWSTPYFNGSAYTTNGNKNCDQSTGNFASWDPADPDAFLCTITSSYPALDGAPANRPILLLVEYTGNDVASPAPCAVEAVGDCSTYGKMQGQILPMTVKNLTPCSGACDDPNTDYTLHAQIKRVAGDEWDSANFSSCGVSFTQGNYALGGCSDGQQDSWSVFFIFDLGNRGVPGVDYVGSSGNTQQVISFLNPLKKKYGRFCGNHTGQSPIGNGVNVLITEVDSGKCAMYTRNTTQLFSCSNASGLGTCGACPAGIGTIDGVNYEGTNRCALVEWNSSTVWSGAGWGSTPAGYEEGDAIGVLTDSNCGGSRWFGNWQVGDLVCRFGECMKFLKKDAPGRWWMERGFGQRNGGGGPQSHSTDSNWPTKCNAMELNSDIAKLETYFGGWMWYYLEDPTGANLTWTKFNNHAFHTQYASGKGARVFPKFVAEKLDVSNRTEMTAMPYYFDSSNTITSRGGSVNLNGYTFAGKGLDSFGNQLENHPGMAQVNASAEYARTFVDIHPVNFLTQRQTPGGTVLNASNVTGYLWKFGAPNSLSPKHHPIAAFMGANVVQLVTGETLTGNAADRGKGCYVFVAGECYAGSSVGEFYWNMPNFDGSTVCREAEFGANTGDKCVNNWPPHGAVLAEYLLPYEGQLTNTNLQSGRVLSRAYLPYRSSVTGNAKATSDGKRLLLRDETLIVTIPPIPLLDGTNRAEFDVRTLRVSGIPVGATNVIVRFGYDDANTLRCTPNRAEVCVANAATVNRANPYLFPSEGTGGVESGITGVSCASGCSVAIPTIHNRPAYYQIVYRDGAGSTISTDPVKPL